ncbi:hypothetical protein FRC03_003344 [Tulasnella sp. 419]|nr:hypothetical protein FRC02_010273 [Tulasnella sp. 418]KAG8942302.1 hypothetical protein FRC03_003344 [Tulasnella sp. 419]
MSGEELAFAKTFIQSISSIPLAFTDDFQPALEDVPRKVQVFPIEILPPPEKKLKSSSAPGSQGGFTLTIKSTKPPLTFQVTGVQPSDSVQQLKSALAEQHLRAPLPDSQRLLLKGKVLSDSKLLKEYSIDHTSTLTLMAKQGAEWTGDERSKISESPRISQPAEIVVAHPSLAAPKPSKPHAQHTRSTSSGGLADQMEVPSLVLSPTPGANDTKESPVSLKLDTDLNSQPDPPRSRTPNSYHTVISSPEFWSNLREFLRSQFKNGDDADAAWEEFFLASKAHLTPHQIALVRDVTGVVAMAGV